MLLLNLMKRAKKRTLKDYFVPHKGNKYKPQIFARDILASVAIMLLLCEGAYLFQVDVLSRSVNFTASVLPAALESLTNADRVQSGLQGLKVDPQLTIAAQNKANDMAAKGYFSHVSPDGKTPWYWLDQIQYNYAYAGENLAIDFVDTDQVEKAWMNSPSHHANIVKPEYTNIGIGVAQGMYQGHQTTFVVELFASLEPIVSTPVAAATPSSKAQVTTPAPVTTVSAGNPTGQVLGEATKPVAQVTASPVSPIPLPLPSPSLAQRIFASPTQTMFYLLWAFTGLVLALLAVSVFMHVRRRLVYVEVATGGLALAGLAVLIVTFNGVTAPSINLPTDTQSASAVQALK